MGPIVPRRCSARVRLPQRLRFLPARKYTWNKQGGPRAAAALVLAAEPRCCPRTHERKLGEESRMYPRRLAFCCRGIHDAIETLV